MGPGCRFRATREANSGISRYLECGVDMGVGVDQPSGGYTLQVSWIFHSMGKGTVRHDRVLKSTEPRAEVIFSRSKSRTFQYLAKYPIS